MRHCNGIGNLLWIHNLLICEYEIIYYLAVAETILIVIISIMMCVLCKRNYYRQKVHNRPFGRNITVKIVPSTKPKSIIPVIPVIPAATPLSAA